MEQSQRWHLRGARWLDVTTGETSQRDLTLAEGVIVDHASDAVELDVSGLTALFGLWDCHAHPGGLMYDPEPPGTSRQLRTGRSVRARTSRKPPGWASPASGP